MPPPDTHEKLGVRSQRIYVDHFKDPIIDDRLFETRRLETATEESAGAGVKRSAVPFPQLLYQMLEQSPRDGFDSIVSWAAHGRAFRIHDTESFEQHVLPKYFQTKRHSSFIRQISIYQFFRTDRGPDNGSWFHEYLLRGRPDLTAYIQRENHEPGEKRIRRGRSSSRTWSVNLCAMPTCSTLSDEARMKLSVASSFQDQSPSQSATGATSSFPVTLKDLFAAPSHRQLPSQNKKYDPYRQPRHGGAPSSMIHVPKTSTDSPHFFGTHHGHNELGQNLNLEARIDLSFPATERRHHRLPTFDGSSGSREENRKRDPANIRGISFFEESNPRATTLQSRTDNIGLNNVVAGAELPSTSSLFSLSSDRPQFQRHFGFEDVADSPSREHGDLHSFPRGDHVVDGNDLFPLKVFGFPCSVANIGELDSSTGKYHLNGNEQNARL